MDHTVPYPLPDDWQLRAARPMRTWVAVLLASLLVAATGLAVWALIATNGAAALILGMFITVVGLLTGMGFEHAGAERELPRFVNAVTLGDASVRPHDSWVHLFRETGLGRWLSTWFVWVGVTDTVIMVWLIVKAFQPGGQPSMLFLFVPLLLVSLILLLAGLMALAWRYQLASFARSSTGISLGEHALISHPQVPERTWRWDELRAVTPQPALVDPTTKDFSPSVLVEFVDGREPKQVSLSDYESHAWLMYTAIRFYLEHPQLRTELSTTFAQRRITAWRDTMFAVDRITDSPA